MDPKDFCNWFQGILDFNKTDDGGIMLDASQVSKIEAKLDEALDQKTPTRPDPLSGRPPGARC